MPEAETDAGNSGFVLPIICPHCNRSTDLSVVFELLPPKKDNPTSNEHEETEEEGA